MYAEVAFLGGPMDGKTYAIDHEPQPVMSVVSVDTSKVYEDSLDRVATINHEYAYSNLREDGVHVYSYSGPKYDIIDA
jgi:molybdopterin-guanine dinucleotide biosynthesis protein A